LIKGRINCGCPPIRNENAEAIVRMTCQIDNKRPVVALLIPLIKSTALSRSPIRSHIPITGNVKINNVAVRFVRKAAPSVDKISIIDIPPTKPVTIPATTTVANVSNFKAKPMITITIPISLIASPIIKFLLSDCKIIY